MPSRTRLPAGIADATYVELVRSALGTLFAASVMGILFVLVSSHVVSRTDDAGLRWLSLIGIALSLLRIAVLLPLSTASRLERMDAPQALRAERLFAAAYLAFAALIGLFAARAVAVGPPDTVPATITLLVGYGAGVAAGISLRPWIAVPALLLAILPTAVTALAIGDAEQGMLGFVLAAFLAAGVSSILTRYRTESENIALRRAFDELARHDALTGLANRIGLTDLHAAAAGGTPPRLTAIHCLDLDRFKAVNDQHGHPIGDGLLRAVAGRLTRLLRDGDTAARLGGDEFVVLQAGLAHPGEADLFARRIARALSAPYSVNGIEISVGVSIGFAVANGADRQLDDLLSAADEASYRAKRRGGSIPEAASAVAI